MRKASIDPPDAVESVRNVPKKGDPAGPAEAAFYGLVPGRAYNITVETVSGDQISEPTTAEYRTLPLPPRDVAFDLRSLTPFSFAVQWKAPVGEGKFDRYQLSLDQKKHFPLIISASEPRQATFDTNLEPGATYQVFVKTVSGNVASWPAKGNVTTRPLKILDLRREDDEFGQEVNMTWTPDPTSIQDSYKILFQEVEAFNGDARTRTTTEEMVIESLYPGRNYSVSVAAVSNNIESEHMSLYVATKPTTPIIEMQPIPHGLDISWKSDDTSRQDGYAVVHIRNDTGESVTHKTVEEQIVLEDLFPGARYEIKVYAISHGLWSDPHAHFHVVYPNPIRNLTISSATNTTVVLSWLPPNESLFSHYSIRYRPVDAGNWIELPPVNETSVTMDSLQPGERYLIEVHSISHNVKSFTSEQVEHTVPPNPVTGITPVLNSHNITFEWPRPDGRLDNYTIIWWSNFKPEIKHLKEIPGSHATEGIDRRLSIVVEDLMPGELYHFQIHTTAHDVNSEVVELSRRTIPLITSDIRIWPQPETRSMAIIYTPTPESASTFDMYRFMLSDPSIPVKEKPAEDEDRKIVFNNLVPGRVYNVTAWTVSGGVTSLPLIRRDQLNPEPVSNITASYISDTEIALSWSKPAGDYDVFEVQYLDNELLTTNTTKDSVTITKLRPHRNYTFTVLTWAGSTKKSNSVSATFTTKESVPGKVNIFEATIMNPSELTLSWSLPSEEQNGILLGYMIKYRIKGALVSHETRFAADEESGIIQNLTPGETYVFQIEAMTKIGSGPIRHLEKTMPIGEPPQPDPTEIPKEEFHTANTIRVSYRKQYFSDKNGQIIGYTVIVAEDETKSSTGVELRTWKDVQSYSQWPPYQVTERYYPFANTSLETFDIGVEEDCENRDNYCNGPLKPGSTYRVKIRAYTAVDKFADTYYSFPITTDSENANLGLLVAIPVVFVVLVVVLAVAIRQRRSYKSSRKTPDQLGNIHPMPDSIRETSRPVNLQDFVAYFRYMSADSEYRFSEEYRALQHVGHDIPHNAADLPVNRPKNRFTNILPYDHSRFKLQSTDDEEGSDYINANYVSGYNSLREFIVSQGPLPSTRDDFWRMCWESNTRAIVMLTRCTERGRERCDHYWPYNMQPVYYGDVQVTILNERYFPDWSLTEFRVCKGDVCRMIRHFHFTTWPDFGVPDPPQTLVRFVRFFRETVGADQRPIVVHCSAGVGRSGTFIALDRILFSIRTNDYVDLYGIVYEMRRQRVSMVQTERQYICIHQCLLSVLEGTENEHPLSEIHDNQGYEDDEGIAESSM
ncbi:tyrosine-protein phosphatase 10D-like [Penaeus indicus]|uniref:tyrosine-protein phosphatase 10D-like n=1 Tax=Penaeus indicus TaxID=29960 RepID=UPI00300C7889